MARFGALQIGIIALYGEDAITVEIRFPELPVPLVVITNQSFSLTARRSVRYRSVAGGRSGSTGYVLPSMPTVPLLS